MNFIKKLLCRAAPLAVLLLAACGGAVPGGTVPPVLMVSTLAGTTGVVGSADGTGAAASFGGGGTWGVTVDAAGNVYVADWVSQTIRKITPAGVVSTLAGTAGVIGSADGTGAAASFYLPSGITADASGNIYVTEQWNHTIRKITPAGAVSTLAGTAGVFGSADGTGAAARFYTPIGIAADSGGNLYVADMYNHTIRKITPAGTVTTLAGQAWVSGSADGTGAAARFNAPICITLDSAGNLYVTDAYNYTIRKITPAGVVTTLAGTAGVSGSADGTGAAARFRGPRGIAADADANLYVADWVSNTIRKITPAGVVTTLAGTAGVEGSADGPATKATFASPSGIAIDPNGNIYVGDFTNNNVRKIGPGYNIGGKVSGLTGALILQNSNGDTKTLTVDGDFKMDMPVAEGAAYSATVQTPPAGQNCTVTGGSGTATAHVSDISVSCTGTSATAYTIGGTVSGLTTPLTGTLVLKNSNGDKQTITGNVAFSFVAPVAQAGAYNVTVATQPNGQTCTVANGNGTASVNVSNVTVSCVTNSYTIGGTVSGLTGTLALQNNGGDSLNLTANAPFTFATPIAHGGAYDVTVLNQPLGQTCSVRNMLVGAASVTATANVTTLSVSCVANTYTIGGTVSGLTASGLVLTDNGVDNLTVISGASSFTFATSVTSYNVAVLTQPAGQTCTVTSGTGTAVANVSTVAVSCVNNAAPTYIIGGTVVSGLTGTLVLQNNGADNLSLTANAPFTFTTAISGAYNVTVLNQPAGQTCTVISGGSGTATANIGNVAVNCVSNAAPTYTIGGVVSGLTGTVVLQNNNGDNLNLTANAPFTFTTAISGAYNVTVLTQPAGQTCTVTSGGSGTATATVTNVAVDCVNNAVPTYTIGGTVTGLSGTLVLQDNNGDDLNLTANGNFTFATAIGGAYNVTVFIQPAGQTCTVISGGSGTATANVSNVAISCANNVVTYVVNVTAPSLTSTSVELQNNGGDNLIVFGTGFAAPFTFATPIASGGAYNVTVLTQPTNGQTCSVISGSGTSTTDVTITVNCI